MHVLLLALSSPSLLCSHSVLPFCSYCVLLINICRFEGNQRGAETLELGWDHLGPSPSPSRRGMHVGMCASTELCAVKKTLAIFLFTDQASSEVIIQNLACVSLALLPITFAVVL